MPVLRLAAASMSISPAFLKNPQKPNRSHLPLRKFSESSFKYCNSTKSFQFPLSVTSNSLPRNNKHRSDAFSFSFSSLDPIKPYVRSEWNPILKGWICSVISVYCLSRSVPTIGKFSTILTRIDVNRFFEEGLVLGVLVLVRSAANYWQQAFLWEAALNSAYKIRVYVFERVLQRDLGFFEGSGGVSAGDISYRITAEASDVADTVYALLNTIVPNTLQLAAMAYQMLVISPVLSMISALVIPCISVIIAHFGEKLRKISRNAHLSVARLSTYLNEVLPSMLFVKANNSELGESARFQRLAHNDLAEHLKKKKMKALIPQIIQVICIGALLIFCAGSLVVSGGFFDGSSMVSFITSLVLLIEPVRGVGKAYNEWKQGEPAIERLFDLTRFNSEVIEKPDAVDLDSVTGDVKFCGITFKYRDSMHLVLNGLNLHIKSGETVALIGPSGGGKTTLTKLLLRLYDPLHGNVLLDDHDIRNLRLESLRRHIALVSQDITLFSGTVAENIGYEDLMGKINMEQVEHSAKIANADEFIMALPHGYETNVGQRGSLLSGGQKQRLAIARALYQNSSILILDEATSALDSRSELLVRQAMEHLLDSHTVLVVAHRLETVLMADRVVLLDGGKVEEVSRSSLLAKDGQYGPLLSNGLIK
ncbi:ABC2 homolog 12 [Tasmannia lanceolata]|uniref:ABC2 homolog 12 n=1 Tax=Tasmannia lanceolata TaxID=3420 RepID=UPI0040633275